jgi:hypothetical protein
MNKVFEWVGNNKEIVTSWTAILAVFASTVTIIMAMISMRWQRIIVLTIALQA